MYFNILADIKKYVVVLNANFKIDNIEPKLKEMDRDVLKLHFGSAFVEEVQGDYDTAGGVIASLPLKTQKIIEKFRSITAPFAMAHFITQGQVQIDNAGIFIASTENRKTAFEWQIKDLIDNYLKPGFQAVEETIIFLQDNIGDYPTYQNSDEFAYYKGCFVPNSKEFTRLYTPLNFSFMNLIRMRSCMDKAEEQEVRNVLLPSLYNDIKSKLLTNTLGVAEKALLPMIKKAVVNLTVARALSELNATFDKNGFMVFDNTSGVKSGASKKTAGNEIIISARDSLQKSGNTYLKDIKEYLDKNKISYPLYTGDPDYKTDQPSTFNNTAGQGYYFAG